MIKEYRFNKIDTRKYLYKVLIQLSIYFVVLLAGLIVYKGISDSSLITKIIIGVSIVWGILYLAPLFILYINHSINSNNVMFSYDDENKNFRYKSTKKDIGFNIDDIEKVELYLTPNAYEKSIDWQYFGNYHYYRFLTHNTEPIKLSCLVCDEIEEFIPEKLIYKKKKYLPIVA